MDPEALPRHARLPVECRFTGEVSAAAVRLEVVLSGLDAESLPISDYIRGYLGRHRAKLRFTLQKDSLILLLALAGSSVPLQEFVLVDYGGGVGTLSMLAKESGIGTVIYVDIYDVSCRDAAAIAGALGRGADHYLCGEIGELVEFVLSGVGRCDAVASVNVIEHVYDINALLDGLGDLPAARMNAVLSTSANPFNPAPRAQLAWKHYRCEHRERQAAVRGHKEIDTTESYLGARRLIIERCLEAERGGLRESDLDHLARATRGRAGADVESAALEYVRTGALPQPEHRSNTCDPYTGNWMERLMDPYSLARRLGCAGFDVDILAGYYASSQPVVRALSGPLNRLIGTLGGRAALFLAPGYILYARR